EFSSRTSTSGEFFKLSTKNRASDSRGQTSAGGRGKSLSPSKCITNSRHFGSAISGYLGAKEIVQPWMKIPCLECFRCPAQVSLVRPFIMDIGQRKSHLSLASNGETGR